MQVAAILNTDIVIRAVTPNTGAPVSGVAALITMLVFNISATARVKTKALSAPAQ